MPGESEPKSPVAQRMENWLHEQSQECCDLSQHRKTQMTPVETNRHVLRKLAFVLGHPTRIEMLALLVVQEKVCSCEFEWALEKEQSLISRHLKKLVEGEIVQVRRKGKWKVYWLTKEVREAFNALVKAMGGQELLRIERYRT